MKDKSDLLLVATKIKDIQLQRSCNEKDIIDTVLKIGDYANQSEINDLCTALHNKYEKELKNIGYQKSSLQYFKSILEIIVNKK